jgi:hypothetical protein
MGCGWRAEWWDAVCAGEVGVDVERRVEYVLICVNAWWA